MKKYDPPCTITISNIQGSCEDKSGFFGTSDNGPKKIGYVTFDDRQRKVGICFMADDRKTARYGNAEILFFNEFKNEFGTWRIIKINKQYLSFEQLKIILAKNEQCKLNIDGRYR